MGTPTETGCEESVMAKGTMKQYKIQKNVENMLKLWYDIDKYIWYMV